MKQGDAVSFNENWKKREEACFTHWVAGEPENQIQLAFRNHWTLFNELMKSNLFNKGRRCLEVGCGRGTMSCYFSDDGYDCTLADLSKEAIERAKEIFAKNNLNGSFLSEDVNKLSFKDSSFNVVFSIGLLEHFEDIETPLKEMIRVLDKGGLFLGYVVPSYQDNVQKDYAWINEILKGYVDKSKVAKKEVYRSDVDSKQYVEIMKKNGLADVQASGVYPLPMISHSIDFPFTLMPEESEKVLVREFNAILEERKRKTGKHPWLCREGYGQAFLLWGYKI